MGTACAQRGYGAVCSGPGHTVIESVELESDGRDGEVLVARVRPKAGVARRCSRCQRRCPGYDTSATPRRWRGLDFGSTQVFLQARTRRVSCPEHGVVVAAVPWARGGVAVHRGVRGQRRVAGLSRHAQRGRGLVAGGVAQRVRHRGPGGGRAGRAGRPAGGAAPDRDRRDFLMI